MALAKAGRKSEALERARAARLKIDAERDKRDQAVEKAAAGFFDAADRHQDLLSQLAAVDQERGQAVATLMGPPANETVSRIGELLGIDAREVRRLRDLAATQMADQQPTASSGD